MEVSSTLPKQLGDAQGWPGIVERQLLSQVWVQAINHLLARLLRRSRPLPFWCGATIVALGTIGIGCIVAFLRDEFTPTGIAAMWVAVSGAAITLLGVIVLKYYMDYLVALLQTQVIPALGRPTDSIDLFDWFGRFGNKKLQLLVCMATALGFGTYTARLITIRYGGTIGIGTTITFILNFFQLGLLLYCVIIFVALPIRLSRYTWKLYANNPSSTEVLHQIYQAMITFVYLFGLWASFWAVVTQLLQLFNELTLGIFILFCWIPIITVFISYQHGLSSIIKRAKWQKLNALQAQIETLEQGSSSLDKETLERVNKLIDYHDRIKGTPNSLFDIRSILNFLNSLLLPIFGFLLANIDNVIRFIVP